MSSPSTAVDPDDSTIVAPEPFIAAPALVRYLHAQFETWLAIAMPVDDQRLTCVVDMTDMPDAERFAVLMAFIGDGFSLIQEERDGRTICTIRHTARGLRDVKKPKADADPVASPKKPRTKWTKEEDTKIILERSAGRQFRSIGKDLGLTADVVKQRYAELILESGRG